MKRLMARRGVHQNPQCDGGLYQQIFSRRWLRACFTCWIAISVLFVPVDSKIVQDAQDVSVTVNVIANIPTSEYLALYELYNSTNGAGWRWSELDVGNTIWHFAEGADPCKDQWQGIRCTVVGVALNSVYHIQGIELSSRNLCGPIPASIDDLPYLQQLDMPANHINGSIPSSMGNLPQLQYLNIKDNYLTGTIPWSLSNVSLLQKMEIDFNYLSGPVPMEEFWAKMTNMTVLLISHNLFTGTIPEVFGSMLLLQQLDVSYNQLHGSIPTSLGNLTQLQYLDVSSNTLVGTCPDLARLTKLSSLSVRANELHGPLPTYFDQMQDLTDLFFDDNCFTGTLPSSIGAVKVVKFLQVQDNCLTGSIPAALGSIDRLTYFYVNNNFLSGSIPKTFNQLKQLSSLLVQQNILTGNLEGVFNHTTQRRLSTIQLSNNQLTGYLPDDMFMLPNLQALIAVSNCFEGSLPDSICGADHLATLAMDGLRSASSCTEKLLPAISSAYKLSYAFSGTLPACVFDLPYLNTLHLSGNSLTGGLPPDVVILPNLIDISLSHNFLSGEIPTNIQNRIWYNLDLSYNRFEGELRSDFYRVQRNLSVATQVDGLSLNYSLDDSTASLILENNRFSGHLPGSVSSMLNISILTGNLFGCDIAQTQLPVHDTGIKTYQCGSNLFDVPYFLWLALVIALVGLCAAVYRWRRDLERYLGLSETVNLLQEWLSMVSVHSSNQMQDINNKLKNVRCVCLLFDEVTAVAGWCTLFVLLALLPFYLIVTTHYGTHSNKYAYSASGVYIGGRVPFGLEMTFLLILMAILLCTSVYCRRRFDQVSSTLLAESDVNAALSATRASDTKSMGKDNVRKTSQFERITVCAAFFLISVIVVLGVNIAFVYIALYQGSALLVLAQVLMSFFKVFWNLVCAPSLIRWTSSYLSSEVTGDPSAATSDFFTLQLFVALFNNIAIPCLVVAAIDPNCFYNLFVSDKPEVSRYVYAECNDYSVAGCVNLSRTIAASSYSPPYTYGYQCSSSLITYYAPAFVNLCIVSTFLTPLLQVAAIQLHHRAIKGTTWYSILDCMPRILKPVPPVEDSSADNFAFFKPDRVFINLVTNLGLLLTFGAMFPPLAAALAVTIFCEVCFAKLKVGRFLYMALEAQQFPRFASVIAKECELANAPVALRNSLWMLITVSCWFYTLFLFDTLGDAVGLSGAFWVLIVMPLMPLCFYISYCIFGIWDKSSAHRAHSASESTVGVEMHAMAGLDVDERSARPPAGFVLNVLHEVKVSFEHPTY